MPIPLDIKFGLGAAVGLAAAAFARRVPRWAMLCLAGVACGTFYALAHAVYWLDQRLPAGEDAVERVIAGEVVGFPRRRDRLTRVELKLKHPVQSDAHAGRSSVPGLFYGTVRLNCYDCPHTFAPGQAWQVAARLRGIHGLANPGLFDYERWAFQRRLVASGTLLDEAATRLLEDTSDSAFGAGMRGRFNAFLDGALADKPGAGILRAVTVGARHGIDEDQWRVFRRTGTSHLVAISGLHVGLVFGFAFTLASMLARLCPPLLRRIPAQRLAALAALPPTVIYASLAGFSLPTQRAAVMLGVFYIAFLFGRRVMGWHTFCVALAVVVILDPFASLSQGFWLSFGAVAAIVCYINRSRGDAVAMTTRDASLKIRAVVRLRRVMAAWVGIQCAVSALVVPMSALFFGQLAIASPLFNLVAIPYFSLAVVPPALLGVFSWMTGAHGAAQWLLSFAAQTAAIMQEGLAVGAQWPFVSLSSDAVDVTRVVLGLMLLAALIAGVRRTPVAVFALVSLMSVSRPLPPPPGAYTLTVLDVGQGLAAVVRTRTHTLVFDTGVRYGSGYDMGRIVVNPYLEYAHATPLDVLVISHGDRDHAGGRAAVTAAHPRALVYDSERGRRGPGLACVDGVRWFIDEVGFEFLSPPDISRRRHNNRSCVLRVWSRYGQTLLPGDIEKEAERRLVERHGGRLASDLLVVPHHGSKTSSSAGLLARVDPSVAIVSRGLSNSYGHPHESVTTRYRRLHTRWFDTAFDGAVKASIGPDGIGIWAYRRHSRPIWRSRPVPAMD